VLSKHICIQEAQNSINGIQTDIQTLSQHPHPTDGFVDMEIQGVTYTDKADAGTALMMPAKIYLIQSQ